MPKVGAHVSSAISLELSFERARKIGADCFQIFISPPQQWLQTEHSEEEINKFLELQQASGIGPNFIHGTYLVNLGTQKEEHLQKSIDWLVFGMNMANKLNMKGVIFHIGSHKGNGFDTVLKQISDSLKQILSKSPKHPNSSKLILETSAGGGGTIGRDFKELGQILQEVNDPRLKICLDIQHVFAAGYDVREPLTLKDVLEEFEEQIGLNNLAVIHANDSKTEYKSLKDRHENIGEGLIGSDGFSALVNHPSLKDIPFILEVPGLAGTGPDKENVSLLKSLIK